MINRRNFLKSSSLLVGGVGLMGRSSVFAAESTPSGYFGVHPFVEQHPEAVFILRTHVDRKTNSDACKRVGLDLGRSIFVPMDNTGVPVTHNIATKPNLTAHDPVDAKRGFTLEDTMGIATDVFFVEGLFESLKELGVAGSKMHTRDVNGGGVLDARGYLAMGRRVGATVRAAKNTIRSEDDANDERAFVWKEVPGGVVCTADPLPVALQCAGFLEPECGEIQGSRNGFDPHREELAGHPCGALSGILPKVAQYRCDAKA